MMLWLKKLKYRFSNERQLNLALKQVLANVLKHQSGAFVERFIPSEGICTNLAVQGCYTRNKKRISELFNQWPDRVRAGQAYPVGGVHKYCKEREAGTIWQNPRRIQLLQWMIEQTEFKP